MTLRAPKLLLLSLAAIPLAACVEDTSTTTASLPMVGSSTDLTAFQGARAGQAENGIQALGYQLIRTQGLTAYWFNPSTGACAEIVTSDGRYSSVTMLASDEC